MITVCISSHKGGTGKTTTAVNLAHGLARDGARVLLVDLDAQGNAADFLGLEPAPGLFRLLIDRLPLAEVAIPTGRPGFDLVPGSMKTAAIPALLAEEPGRDALMRRALRGAPYDWAILDTAPSLGLLQTLALAAADLLVVPTELEFASGLGVAQVIRTMARINEALELRVRLAGILPTKWDRRLSESRAQLDALGQRFPGKVWLPIPTDAKAAEAPAYGKTLWEYAPTCPAVIGRDLDGSPSPVGGYAQAVERMKAEAGR